MRLGKISFVTFDALVLILYTEWRDPSSLMQPTADQKERLMQPTADQKERQEDLGRNVVPFLMLQMITLTQMMGNQILLMEIELVAKVMKHDVASVSNSTQMMAFWCAGLHD